MENTETSKRKAGRRKPPGKGQDMKNTNSYRGIEFEAWKDGGFIVDIMGDEIFCDNISAVEKLIDNYLDD